VKAALVTTTVPRDPTAAIMVTVRKPRRNVAARSASATACTMKDTGNVTIEPCGVSPSLEASTGKTCRRARPANCLA
jgi:hypothetical protein